MANSNRLEPQAGRRHDFQRRLRAHRRQETQHPSPAQHASERRTAALQTPGDFQVSPVWIFRSALPVATIQGLDLNNDFTNNDIPDRAFAYNPDDPTKPLDNGACPTWQCGRGYRFSQANIRISKAFRLGATARVTAIGEVFNIFNTENPSGFVTRRFTGSIANPVPNATFMQPTTFAGDFRQ